MSRSRLFHTIVVVSLIGASGSTLGCSGAVDRAEEADAEAGSPSPPPNEVNPLGYAAEAGADALASEDAAEDAMADDASMDGAAEDGEVTVDQGWAPTK